MTGAGILKTAKALRVGTGTVHRVKREMTVVADALLTFSGHCVGGHLIKTHAS
jgi:hypothetical protein